MAKAPKKGTASKGVAGKKSSAPKMNKMMSTKTTHKSNNC